MKWFGVLFLCGWAGLWGSLETKPWLPAPYEPQLHFSYTYSTYPKVANATGQLHKRSHDQLLEGGISLATLSDWAGDLDCAFARTPRFSWGLRNVGAQVRKQWLNDIARDLISLTTGMALQIAAPKLLHDVSTPFHSPFNGEISVALGKEWSQGFFWRGRIYQFIGLGLANQGAPWIRSRFSLALNRDNFLQFETFALYYRGFGHHVGVQTKPTHFDGWKVIDHRSIDCGLSFRYLFTLYGSLTLEITKRLYARSYPDKVFFVQLRYDLPLSF